MNPGHDNNNDEPDRWNPSDWDLHSVNGPDDFDEFQDEDDGDEPLFELAEDQDEDAAAVIRSISIRRGIRIVALLALLFFVSVFVLPSAINAVRTLGWYPKNPDYYELIYPNDAATARFEKKVIKYSIVTPDTYPESARRNLEDTVLNAMNNWSEALDGNITFVEANPGSSDDLLVRFVTDLPSAGLASIRRGTRYCPEISIRLGIHTSLPSSAILETVACHELGHALGIWGHSDYEGDCMYPIAGRRTPSPRDIRTIRLIYGLEEQE